MLKSKRFLSLIAEIILFCFGAFLFKIDPIPLATGLGIIFAPYMVAQSIRGSAPDETNKK